MSSELDDSNLPENGERTQGIGVEKTLRDFEQLVANLAQPCYVFCLYVSGSTRRSTAAVMNVRRVCEQYLAGHYELKVIDVYQQPTETKQAQIVAVPTLIKELPFPPRRFIGDMSNPERIVVGLNLRDFNLQNFNLQN